MWGVRAVGQLTWRAALILLQIYVLNALTEGLARRGSGLPSLHLLHHRGLVVGVNDLLVAHVRHPRHEDVLIGLHLLLRVVATRRFLVAVSVRRLVLVRVAVVARYFLWVRVLLTHGAALTFHVVLLHLRDHLLLELRQMLANLI